MPTCTHRDMIRLPHPAAADKADGVCPECVAAGSRWVHLRMCLTCGHVGCCDSSPERHARRHYESADHPIIVTYQPGEDWSYCYVDDAQL